MNSRADLRKHARRRVALRATVSDGQGQDDYPCLVRDVSQSGCCIVCSNLNKLSDAISLQIERVARPIAGRVVWRRGKMAGIELTLEANGLDAAGIADMTDAAIRSQSGGMAESDAARASTENDGG